MTKFRLLGPVEAHDERGPVALSATKLRTVLGALLLSRSRVVSDDRLTALLWGDRPPATAGSQIQTYMSRLRQRLGRDVEVIRRNPGYLLQAAPDQIDLYVFERLTARGRQELASGRAAEAARLLREALTMWQGPALVGVTEFLGDAERPRLEEARLAAIEDRITADLALGVPDDLVSELTRLVAEHPLRERLRARLMTALHLTGRRADALTAYAAYRGWLADELGIDPGADLQQLHASILAEPDVPAAQAALPARLPADVADFTGRQREIARVVDALRPERAAGRPAVCVVAGMAGVGKTALAVRAAHRSAADYPGGQVYVDLRAPDALATILETLGLPPENLPADIDERLRAYRDLLSGRRVLVLLDNAVDERQVRPLLPQQPGCAALVTARARLVALPGAELVDIGVLPPDDALALLSRIVGDARVAREPSAAQRIVRFCGCLPLGVRIAGARLAAKPHWKLSQLASRLADHYGRLDELQVADLEVRASVVVSYQGLDQPAQRAFRLLSLVAGRQFPAWTAAAVLDLPLARATELVESLVDVRLLEVVHVPGASQVRYRFHDLVRSLALERVAAEEPPEQRRTALRRALGWWPRDGEG
ncbi:MULTISPECIES: AfsR/SARP family transcriptional regulator [Amycolatopsis]|uniref:BTAD domain-containing putative transcriptional regulator n=1 Tax=Amycolatopsis albidoflavus TaxID=102226 RepID=A0ABW5I7D6_9PSEU